MEAKTTIMPGSTDIIGGIVTTLEPAPNSRHVHGHLGYRDLLKKFGTDEAEDSVARGTCVPRIPLHSFCFFRDHRDHPPTYHTTNSRTKPGTRARRSVGPAPR